MEKFKSKFGRHPWGIKYVDNGSVSGAKLQITHESFVPINDEELTLLIKGIMELNVRFTVWYYPRKKPLLGANFNPNQFSVDLDVR